MLVLCLEAINDKNNGKPPSGFEPLFAGITVFTIGSSYGVNTGYAINPARDLGPRIFTQLAGWKNSFKRGNNLFDSYWWIPLIGPMIGAIAGALMYKYVVGVHLASLENDDLSPHPPNYDKSRDSRDEIKLNP